MLIGHVGAALAGKRARRSVGLLVLLIATYVPDWADIGLCLVSASTSHGMLTHSIPAVLLFMLVGFAAYAVATRDLTGALVIALVILSHMLFDWITGYKPTWPGGPMIGLELYDHPISDFLVEAIVIVVGALLYGRTLPPRRRPWADVSIMAGALISMQLTIEIARVLMKSLPKC
jgi:hypothetical protein